VVTKSYFQNVYLQNLHQRHPELWTDPESIADMAAAHHAALAEGLELGDPDYDAFVGERMGWNGARTAPRSIPGGASAPLERPVEKHGYSGQELPDLTEEEAIKISGVTREEYLREKKRALDMNEIGAGKKYW
jgi:hypothetical protein